MSVRYESVPFVTCASSFATFRVPSSKGDETYAVTLYGEGRGHCTCEAYRHGRGKECKHIAYVRENACLYSAFDDSGCATVGEVGIIPAHYNGNESQFLDEKCPVCGGPTLSVRYAV